MTSRTLNSPVRNIAYVLTACVLPFAAWAHGPIFSFNPKTLYKGGVALEGSFNRDVADGRATNLYQLKGRYGVTGDWTVGVSAPYVDAGPATPGPLAGSGLGDVHLLNQYRFWRQDSKGIQRSATIVNDLKLDTSGSPQGTGSTDLTTGLVYGYESIHWYHWASAGYVWRGLGPDGLRRGNTTLLNLVGGWRPRMPVYGQADTVFLLGLNTEIAQRTSDHGQDLANTGGTQVFLSPGLIWTDSSNSFAVRPGIQIPIYSNLNGNQPSTDYRLRVELEYHY